MIDLGRLPVLVSAKNTNIEVVARIFKIVRVASVKRNLLFGSKDETDIVVSFVAIEVVNGALIKGDHIGAKASLVFTFLFDRGDGGIARGTGLIGRHAWLNGAINARRHVLD